MAMRRTSRERYSALLVGLVYLLVFSAAWARFGTVALLPALATLLTLLLLFGFYCIHKIRGDIRDGTSQLQSVLDIRAAVRADLPLPPFGSPMIEADCGSVIVRHILKYRPGLIVEAGSGSSTVLAASCLKQIGAGKVVALEHLKPWAELAHQNLQSLGLAEYGCVRYAPLERQQCNGLEYEWFAAGAQQFDRPIDLLFVDGPPSGGAAAPLSRFPVLPLLARHLNDQAWVIVDDTRRRDSRRMLERWRTLFADWGFEERILPTKRGTGLIRLRRPPGERPASSAAGARQADGDPARPSSSSTNARSTRAAPCTLVEGHRFPATDGGSK
jgi:predicted O-methyltransferase YrrM